MHTCRFVIIKNHSCIIILLKLLIHLRKILTKIFTNKTDIPALLYINYINCTLIMFNMKIYII